MTATMALPWANLLVPGADGTQLALDVHLPVEASWPVPVVVTRTAYGRSKHLAEGRGWRNRGYAYVVADVRGRYDSDGEWSPYRNERADGAALVDWITAQPWCDGRLIAYGGSYSGYTAWATAVERPDAVAAVISLGPSMSLAGTKFDRSGVLRLGEHAAWWLERAESRTSRDGVARLVFGERPDLLDHLPVVEIGDRLGARLPHWPELLTVGDPGEPITDAELAQLECAALHVGGWYDLLLPESLRHGQIVGSAHTPRPCRRLVIGPWGHDLAFSDTTTVGAREHGPNSRMGFDRLALDWLSDVLGGSPPPDRAEVFVLGANTWHASTDWPGPSIESTLHTDRGGVLRDASPAGREWVEFGYNPLDPFPSRRPATDRSDTAHRVDAARFRTPALSRPWTIWGEPWVDLAGVTDAPTADWTLRLLEQTDDGRLLELARGTRVDGAERRRVVLSPVAITVPIGSVLVLEVTASDFPDLARNLGTAGNRYTESEAHPSTQRIHCGVGGTTLHLPLRPELAA